MARRNNQLVIPVGPVWTSVFRADSDGGSDGAEARGLLLTCASNAPFPLEYRVDAPADPAGQQARLEPGEAIEIIGINQKIRHITMRGIGGESVGGVEETRF